VIRLVRFHYDGVFAAGFRNALALGAGRLPGVIKGTAVECFAVTNLSQARNWK